ncbi:hypothetical protein HK405_014929 [Cladochytrium tenue]|nr:hypothetical protein HK405_014929 [Cladochytrium tenue]
MAPEVARAKGYSAKVDIWSLGCLLLEMLSGSPPWHKVKGSVIYLLGTGKTPPIPDNISPLARRFLESCFSVDPERRPRADELLSHPLAQVEGLTFDFKSWVASMESAGPSAGSSPVSDDGDDGDGGDVGRREYDGRTDVTLRLLGEDYDDPTPEDVVGSYEVSDDGEEAGAVDDWIGPEDDRTLNDPWIARRGLPPSRLDSNDSTFK